MEGEGQRWKERGGQGRGQEGECSRGGSGPVVSGFRIQSADRSESTGSGPSPPRNHGYPDKRGAVTQPPTARQIGDGNTGDRVCVCVCL